MENEKKIKKTQAEVLSEIIMGKEKKIKKTQAEILSEVIQDSNVLGDISDGVLTLSELHKDRALLFINLIMGIKLFVDSINAATVAMREGAEENSEDEMEMISSPKLWWKNSDKENFSYMGLYFVSPEGNHTNVGGIFPDLIKPLLVERGAMEDQSMDIKNLPSLAESLHNII